MDLPNSFNIYDDKLYMHQIEPSAKGCLPLTGAISSPLVFSQPPKFIRHAPPGGELITNLVAHIVSTHDAAEMGSVLYKWKGSSVLSEANDFGAANPWHIPHDPADVPTGFVENDHSELDAKVSVLSIGAQNT